MTIRCVSLVLVCLLACSKEEAAPAPVSSTASAPKPADENTELTTHTWAGKVHTSVGEMTFKNADGALTAQMAYRIFGRVIITDQFTVTRTADGGITLKGLPTNKFIGGQRFPLAELVGKLSADKAEISGTHTLPQGEIKWFVSTKQNANDLDPPLDAAVAATALTSAPWQGTTGNKPIKVIFSNKGKLTGELTSGKDKFALDVSVEGSGQVKMVAAPKPTPQGLLNQTFVGYFATTELSRISGSLDSTVKQGFVEQGGESPFVIEKVSAPVKAEKKSKK